LLLSLLLLLLLVHALNRAFAPIGSTWTTSFVPRPIQRSSQLLLLLLLLLLPSLRGRQLVLGDLEAQGQRWAPVALEDLRHLAWALV